MDLFNQLRLIWRGAEHPFLIHNDKELKFSEVDMQYRMDFSLIKRGDVVAIIGDFEPLSILTLLRLIELTVIIVPLTEETANQHEYFFETAQVDVVIKGSSIARRAHNHQNSLINTLRSKQHAGLILFSTGTTGRPKAILHDLTLFLKRFETPRVAFRTISFLLFDHIGGLNTLLHTLFNKGTIIVPRQRTVNSILSSCQKYQVELLPTTPTFLRMMLFSSMIPKQIPASLKIITYGTERMDQATLQELCALLPDVDFRQTYGMSELGILRIKSEARNSLYMKIGGEQIETTVVNNTLHIRSQSRMIGYLNEASPFDSEDWYDTKDIVEEKNGYYKIIGRSNEAVNVGGLKFMASEVEKVALMFPGVFMVQAQPRQNPITGQHVELAVQPATNCTIDQNALMVYLKSKLQSHMVPKRIKIQMINIGYRFKRQ